MPSSEVDESASYVVKKKRVLAGRGAGAAVGIVSLRTRAVDFQPGGSGFLLRSNYGDPEDCWIDALVPYVKRGVVIDLGQSNIRGMVFLQGSPKMFQIALQKVSGAVVQPDGHWLRGTGFADDDIAIVIAVDVSRIQLDIGVAVAECKRSGWGPTQLKADFMRVFMTLKAFSPGRDDIDLTIAVEIAQHPTGDRRGGQRNRSPSNCSCRKAED